MAIERMLAGEYRRLMLFMPPRYGKSTIVSRCLPAYFLGINPDKAILTASYGADLASAMNADVQALIDSERYRELFPAVRLASPGRKYVGGRAAIRSTKEFQVVGRAGYYRSSGVSGRLLGRGYDLGVIDDPYRDRADAESVTKRRNLQSWYNSVFRSRRETAKAMTLIVSTRWHEADLPGTLLRIARERPDADQWSVVSLPALLDGPKTHADDERQIGQALWPDRFPLSELIATRASITPYEWASVYQQRPTAAEGVLYSLDSFRSFRFDGDSVIGYGADGEPVWRETTDSLRIFQVADTAMKETQENDYTAVLTLAVTPGRRILVLDVWRSRLIVPRQYAALRLIHSGRMPEIGGPLTWDDWMNVPPRPWVRRPVFCAVEDAAGGVGVNQQAALDGLPMVPISPHGASKVLRAAPASIAYNQGRVYHLDGAPWRDWFEAELLAFPSGEHDDAADCVAHGVRLANEHALLNGPVGDLITSPTEEEIIARAADVGHDVRIGGTVVMEDDDTVRYGDLVVRFDDETDPWR